MGAVIDWNQLYENGVPQKVSLPGYCFARERHWLDNPDASVTVAPVLDKPDATVASPAKEPPPSQNYTDVDQNDEDDRLVHLLQQLRDKQLDITAVQELIGGRAL